MTDPRKDAAAADLAAQDDLLRALVSINEKISKHGLRFNIGLNQDPASGHINLAVFQALQLVDLKGAMS